MQLKIKHGKEKHKSSITKDHEKIVRCNVHLLQALNKKHRNHQ